MPNELKTLIDERDNDDIINYLETQSSSSRDNFKVIITSHVFFIMGWLKTISPQSTVLQLTVLNDPETLQSILTWGKEKSLTPATGGDACQDEGNPILVSCQQDFTTCMGHLYRHGYRMKEMERDDDQVKQFLRFQASSNIHYLSLEFTEHQAMQKTDEATDFKTTTTIMSVFLLLLLLLPLPFFYLY